MDPICIHEAGHAILCKREFGRVPIKITIDWATGAGKHEVPLGLPAHGHEATQFAAYYYAGQEAIKLGIKLDVLPSDTNPDLGFVGPDHTDCDAAQLKRLARWAPSEIDARGLARTAVKTFWDQLVAIARYLQDNNGKAEEPALEALLATIPKRT